ncbi:hypothetical protein ACFLW5_01135, partial [Chloroflexota bacterium]
MTRERGICITHMTRLKIKAALRQPRVAMSQTTTGVNIAPILNPPSVSPKPKPRLFLNQFTTA